MDLLKAIAVVVLILGAGAWLDALEPTEPCPVDEHYTRINRNGNVVCQGGEVK